LLIKVRMGYKKVCLTCKLSFNQSLNIGSDAVYTCANCGNSMHLLTHRFRPPRKDDSKGWEVVDFLITNGFYYQHIFKIENDILTNVYEDYPVKLAEAKEFVEKYKEQSIK